MISVLVKISNFFLLLILAALASFLWIQYGPINWGQDLRYSIYIASGILLVLTAVKPLWGLGLLAVSAPSLSIIPLYFNQGIFFPILIFTSSAFLAGWLLNASIFYCPVRYFRGKLALQILFFIVIVSVLASLSRYFPIWGYDLNGIMEQSVNVNNMSRNDAVRYVLFDFVNFIIGLSTIFATCKILANAKKTGLKTERFIIACLLVGAFISACIAIYQGMVDMYFCDNKSYYWTRLRRVNGGCNDPNALGTFLGLATSLGLLRLLFCGSFRSIKDVLAKISLAAIVVACLIAIRYSGSRSGFLAIILTISACCFLFMVWLDKILSKYSFKKYARILIITVCLLAIGLPVFFMPQIINTADQKIQVKSDSSSLLRRVKRDFRKYKLSGGIYGVVDDKRRTRFWVYAKEMWGDQPISGYGFGSYVIELKNFANLHNQEIRRIDNACNYYLHYAAELGTFGIGVIALFYLLLTYGYFRIAIKWGSLPRDEQGAVIATAIPFFIFLIALYFGVHTIATEVNLIWAILLGLIVVQQTRILGPVKPLQPAMKLLFVIVVFSLMAWYIKENIRVNRYMLSDERLTAAVGIKGDYGWHKWEKWDGLPFKLRWMSNKTAVMTVPKENLEVEIPIITLDPSVTNNPQKISFFLNGQLVKKVELNQVSKLKMVRLPVNYAAPFQTFFKQHSVIRIEIDRTWSPTKIGYGDDSRDLGIAVGKCQWKAPQAARGGWNNKETLLDGKVFCWTKKRAWMPLITSPNNQVQIPMNAANIFIKYFPLEVALYINNTYFDTISFNQKYWKNYKYTLPPEFKPNSTNIIEFISSRTWKPQNYGFDDKRELGIAIGEVSHD